MRFSSRSRAFLLLSSLILQGVLITTTPLSAAESQVVADRQKYFIFDTLIIAEKTNVTLEQGTVRKSPRNPLMVEDQPWELRYDNLYANVSYDPVVKKYLCWYNPFIKWGAVEAVKRGEEKKEDFWQAHTSGKYKGWATGVTLATSTDGLTWEKPKLGLADWKGSRENNIVAPVNAPDIHGTGVFLDAQEKDPARRFKLFTRISGTRPLGVAFSADGIHFPQPQACIAPQKIHGDTHNNALWAPTLGRYVAYTRMIDSTYGGRIVLRTESKDFIHWSPPVMVLSGTTAMQTYALLPCHDSGLYLGMVMMYDKAQDRTYCELVWSRDTVAWHHLKPGVPFIPNGAKEGDYDWGCVYAAQPLVMEDEIRIYYGGSNGKHFGWREGCLALATLRKDGWACFKAAGVTPGTVTTNPITCQGPDLHISADAEGGSVKATVTAADGQVIATSAPLTGNVTAKKLEFPDGINLAAHAGKPVVIKFELVNASLYAFEFSSR